MTGPAGLDGSRAADTREAADFEDGGDAACWAHLVCPECGAVELEGHRPGCQLGGEGAPNPPDPERHSARGTTAGR
ncbi:MAG: hypothetical protein ACRDV8_00085 [Acidimicrobiales bacterium]